MCDVCPLSLSVSVSLFVSLSLSCPQAELGSRQTVSVEIAKALEDTRRQKEELQLQVLKHHRHTCHPEVSLTLFLNHTIPFVFDQ